MNQVYLVYTKNEETYLTENFGLLANKLNPPGSQNLPFAFCRWDIQRIREQRMFQRLQQRMNRKKVVPESEPELSSFYPDTEDGMASPPLAE